MKLISGQEAEEVFMAMSVKQVPKLMQSRNMAYAMSPVLL